MPTQSLTQRCSELLQLGLTHHQADRLAEAESCYREILQQEPQHPDALHLLAVIAQQRGQYDDAIELIGAAIRKHPISADYHNNLGNTYRLRGNLAAAIASYRRATALDPDHVDALHSSAHWR
jgi:protein O-GlcNAc transferase